MEDKWQAKISEYNNRFWFWVIVAHLAVLGVGLGLGRIDLFVIKIPAILLVIAALAWYNVTSLGEITAPLIGAKLFFGKPIQHLGSGLYYAPRGFCTVTTISGLDFQVEIASDREVDSSNVGIARAEQVDENTLLIRGHTRDFRVVFGSGVGFKDGTEKMEDWLVFNPADPAQVQQAERLWEKVMLTAKSKTDPLNVIEGQTWDPRIVFRGQVANTVEFIPRIGTIEAAATQLEDIVISQLQALVPRMNPAVYLLLLSHLEAKIKNALEWAIGEEGAKRPESEKGSPSELAHSGDINPNHSWGINLLSVSIKGPGIQRGVSKAQATAMAEQVGIQAAAAKAEQERLKKIAEGQAAAENQRRLIAEIGKGLRESAEESGLSPEQIQGAEVAKAIAQGEGKVVLLGLEGFRELLGTAQAVLPPTKTLLPPNSSNS